MANATAVPGKVKLLLRLLDINGNPFVNTECVLEWGGLEDTLTSTTNGAGLLMADVPSEAIQFLLTVKLFTVEASNPQFTVYMQPSVNADQVIGMKRRLNNLGYLALDPKPRVGDMDEVALRALKRFRCANGILDALSKPTGATAAPFEAQTQQRIENAHDTLGPLELLPVVTPPAS